MERKITGGLIWNTEHNWGTKIGLWPINNINFAINNELEYLRPSTIIFPLISIISIIKWESEI